jgi:hypothetical protein
MDRGKRGRVGAARVVSVDVFVMGCIGPPPRCFSINCADLAPFLLGNIAVIPIHEAKTSDLATAMWYVQDPFDSDTLPSRTDFFTEYGQLPCETKRS